MLVVMSRNATEEDFGRVRQRAHTLGLRMHVIDGGDRGRVVLTGDVTHASSADFAFLPGVDSAASLPGDCRLVSRKARATDSVVVVNGVAIGGASPVFCGGPCAVEGRDQILACADAVAAAGAQLLRGGAYKPRTSPYAFQGLKESALRWLSEARRRTGLGIITEAIDVETFALVEEHADCVQIGSRNMQNYSLLRRAGRSPRPILLKRGPAATLDEWLLAAEYILNEGNACVILCERGVRTFATHTRNTLDLSIVPCARRLSHLPVLVDPSHGTGRRDHVYPMSLAAIAVGAAGLLVEVHTDPDRALSDAEQTIAPQQFARIVRDCREIARVWTESTAQTT